MTTRPSVAGTASQALAEPLRPEGLSLGRAIALGELGAREALETTLARVAAADPSLNAVCHVAPDAARALADAVDRELAACSSDAERLQQLAARPFLGVPLLLKDVGAATACTWLPSRLGSRVSGETGQAWPVNAELTRRYLAAGFIPFGRTTSPEMGMSASTEATAYGGPTRNPYDLRHSAGGSSGGAAAAIASGMVPLAHANDGAGSIRIPASACALVGLKPSRGLMPMGPLAGEGWGGMAVDHVLTRTVRDCAAVLDATAGADPGAPYAAPALSGFLAALAQPPARLRIGLCNAFFEGDAVHPEVAAAVEGFARRLAALGHRVEPVRPQLSTREVILPVMQVVATGTAQLLDDLGQRRGREVTPDELEPVTWSALQYGRSLRAADYLRAVGQLHALGRRMAAFHEQHDLLLTPTLAEPPAVLGRFAMDREDYLDYRLGPIGLWRYSPFTPLANATGGASISLPAGLSSAGLPIGAMLSGPVGSDRLLLQLAAQCMGTP